MYQQGCSYVLWLTKDMRAVDLNNVDKTSGERYVKAEYC